MQCLNIQYISKIKIQLFSYEVYEFVHINPKIEHFFLDLSGQVNVKY